MTFLRQQHDPPPQRAQCRVAQVDAAELDVALLRVVLPREELGDRRLAGAGGSDQGDVLPGLDRQRQVAHDRTRAVAEGHPA